MARYGFLPGRLGARYTPAGDDRTRDEATVELTTFGWGWMALLLGALDVTLVLGYLVWLARHEPAAAAPPRRPSAWPSVDVIVPVRNEAEWIEEKLRNLEALRYPADRLSRLGRRRRLDRRHGGHRPGADRRAIRASRSCGSRVANKTAQLNAALRRRDAGWVMVTDADARLPDGDPRADDGRRRGRPPGRRRRGAGRAGGRRIPWRRSTGASATTSARGKAGAAARPSSAGPCFVFRRELLGAWPDDVVADDMHVDVHRHGDRAAGEPHRRRGHRAALARRARRALLAEVPPRARLPARGVPVLAARCPA